VVFIMWGFRIRWSRAKENGGEFFCPECGGDRSWRKVIARRWFTLFFIPLFPVGKPVAEAVECETCHKKLQPSVLSKPTSADLSAQLQGSMRLATCTVLRQTDGASEPGRRAAVEAVQRAGMAGYDAAALDHDLRTLDLAPLSEHLAYLSGALELPGKELFLTSVARVAAAGGSTEPARAALAQVGADLGLSPAHVAGVLSQATQPAQPAGPNGSGETGPAAGDQSLPPST
jgi:tellurite resistance protein